MLGIEVREMTHDEGSDMFAVCEVDGQEEVLELDFIKDALQLRCENEAAFNAVWQTIGAFLDKPHGLEA